MKPGLLVLAAGMGSRFGGIKQMQAIGPAGEILLEYSVYDAIKAGFDHVVFVIRRDMEEDFRSHILPRFGKIRVDLVFQDVQDLPPGFNPPPDRIKPWGTGHAILRARQVLNESFAVINADDFYGSQAFGVISEELQGMNPSGHEYCMVAYPLSRTVSPNGTVSRGICRVDHSSFLEDVVEHTRIEARYGSYISHRDSGNEELDGTESVSMNLFGFTPSIFPYLETMFREFLEGAGPGATAEFYIPGAVNSLIHQGKARVKVLEADSLWYGITYKEDLTSVQEGLANLHAQGEYPSPLWS